MKQHILVISQYFYPEEFRINDICKEWIKKGYEITVVTGIPNYPKGKFYKGYGYFNKRKEEYEGIHVVRLPIIPRGKNAIMLMLNYMSFVTAGFCWKVFTGVKADKVFIFEVSPMTQALVGVWYAKKKKVPCYIYVQDLWPENVEVVTGIHNRTILGAIDKMVDYIYKNCTQIFATSPSFVKRIEERKVAWDVQGNSKVKYWPQYAEDFYKPVERTEIADIPDDDRFKIIFTGNIGYAQGLGILPQTAQILKEKGVKCTFVIVGDGRYREELEKEIIRKDVQDMFLLTGRKLPEEVPAYLGACDVAFLSFEKSELWQMTIPAKLQSYMACGMPVLAVAGGETRRVIEEAQCGIVCGYEQYSEIVNAITSMQANKEERIKMSQNAITYNANNFRKSALLGKMDDYMKLS
ncbi:MAG: glycosyltransferase family 4 protein [Lachnospiraceae bacterium]|nr:glycosyltransferase family 4 protein [Lachnospiraceae bacterium]